MLLLLLACFLVHLLHATHLTGVVTATLHCTATYVNLKPHCPLPVKTSHLPPYLLLSPCIVLKAVAPLRQQKLLLQLRSNMLVL